MKKKLLFSVAFISLIFASGESHLSGWLGVLVQAIWSFTCIAICLLSLKRLEREEQ